MTTDRVESYKSLFHYTDPMSFTETGACKHYSIHKLEVNKYRELFMLESYIN